MRLPTSFSATFGLASFKNFQQEADADGTTFDAFPADQGPNLFGCPVETEEMPHKFLGPCWMDDLCVAMSADHCETLFAKDQMFS